MPASASTYHSVHSTDALDVPSRTSLSLSLSLLSPPSDFGESAAQA